MPILTVYNQVSLDGYFVNAQGDMSWAKKDLGDMEWNEYVASNARGGGALVFGRVAYEMMASFWPSPLAARMMPEVAKQMNTLPKLVFSRTLQSVDWANTTLVKGDAVAGMRRLKQGGGRDMVILGGGRLTAQLAEAGLIDEYTFVVNPLVLGAGRTLFEGVTRRLDLKLTTSRVFRNGNVVLTYAAA